MKRKKTNFLLLCIAIVCIGVGVFIYQLLQEDSSYIADDYDWQAILNDPQRKYGIMCNGDTYVLTIEPKEGKSKISGFFIGSSPTDLRQFCGKDVRIKSAGREYTGLPLLAESVTTQYSPMPVVDIIEIEEIH